MGKKGAELLENPSQTSRQKLFGTWSGKLPVSMLSEHCQKQNWEIPMYNHSESPKGHQTTVILRKKNKKTSEMESITYKNDEFYSDKQESKHSIATYALHRINSNLSIHTLLPPSQRDLWQKYNLLKSQEDPDLIPLKYSNDPFLARTHYEIKKQEDIRHQQNNKPWDSYPDIHIPKELRSRLEILIRSNLGSISSHEDSNIDPKQIEKILTQKGFRTAHIKESMLYNSSLQNIIDWLCIHIPEDDLPLSMRPNDKRSIILEKHNKESLSYQFVIDRLVETGFVRLKCEQFLVDCGMDEYKTLSKLCIDLAGIELVESIEEANLEECLAEEKEVLESIYPYQIDYIVDSLGTKFVVRSELAGVIEICISNSSKYPHELPGIAIPKGKFPAYIRLALIQKVLQNSESFLGDQMVYNIINSIEEYVPHLLNNPPALVNLYPKKDAIKFDLKQKSLNKKNANQKGLVDNEDENLRIKNEYSKKLNCTKYQKMLKGRMKLPSYLYKDQIITSLQNNKVLIICGETGCGKWQFILDDVIMRLKGSALNIICTQPRRISATSLADRVADELADKVGDLVGYSIRGESKQSQKTKLLFCTTGVLLRMIQNDPLLAKVSHVIIDEVHERGVDSDFLLVLLRDLLVERKDICVILMSATIEASLLCDYFNAPAIEIPGFTHPVQDIYLEEILELTGHRPENLNIKMGKNSNHSDDDDGCENEMKRLLKVERHPLFQIDYGLIANTVKYICENNSDGAILIFLPGVMEIKKCIQRIKEKSCSILDFVEIFELHSNLTSKEQSQVFKCMPKGKRKIIVSTNIAETSVTMYFKLTSDDVLFVIDTGRVKEMKLQNGILSLMETWASLAACKQRRGRAGRVQPGKSYKLYTTQCAKKYMHKYTDPEQLILQIKSIGIDCVKQFLGKALSPPPGHNIEAALELLENLNALNERFEITALGMHISLLPTDVRIGKMLIFGSIFKCLDKVLTIAAYVSGKSPLLYPSNSRDEAAERQKQFIAHQSDHLTVCNAYDQWFSIKSTSEKWKFCEENYLSMNTFKSMFDVKKQFLDMLIELGYVEKGNFEKYNVNSSNEKIVKSVILAGLYPNTASVQMPKQLFEETGEGAVAVNIKSNQIRFFAKNLRVFIHPSSLLFNEEKYDNGAIVAYGSQVSTSKLFIRDCSTAPGIALLLLGGKVKVLNGGKAIEINNIRFKTFERVSALVGGMRSLLDKTLELKFKEPELDVIENEMGRLCIDLLQFVI